MGFYCSTGPWNYLGHPWDSDRITVLLWDCKVGTPMGPPWDSHWASVGLSWDFHKFIMLAHGRYIGVSTVESHGSTVVRIAETPMGLP